MNKHEFEETLKKVSKLDNNEMIQLYQVFSPFLFAGKRLSNNTNTARRKRARYYLANKRSRFWTETGTNHLIRDLYKGQQLLKYNKEILKFIYYQRVGIPGLKTMKL